MRYLAFLSWSALLFLAALMTLPNKSYAISQEEIKSILSYFTNERNNFARTATQEDDDPLHDLECNLEKAIVDEIHSYQDVVNDIVNLFTKGEFEGKTYEYLAEMTDTFGSRITGSEALEETIDWVISTAKGEGMKVYTENVTAPWFVRNEESLKMIKPRSADMKLLGLGSTVPTPKEGITADVLVVSSFDELTSLADQAVGKIIVYDVPFVTYGKTVEYRSRGAVEAAKVGAVASLMRSVTTFSIDSPHTGTQFYSDSVPKIPSACITIEDSTFMHRLQDRGERIILHLYLGAENHENGTITRNTIIEIEGSQKPEEVVVVSAHLDSWDVGVGAMDDGGGCFISWMASRAIKKLNLKPRRTFRTILFSAEEQGIYGGDAYFLAHGAQNQNFQLMMESDFGTFKPHGIFFSGTNEATCMMKEIVSLTTLLGTTELDSPADTPDLETFGEAGVPRGSLINENDHYIWYHHSNGDRIDVYNSTHLDEAAALWTAVSYVAADVSFRLPQSSVSNKFKNQ